MSQILTFTGRSVSLLGVNPVETYNVADIAHALSQICRFGGHTRQFYSVAQHCVLVSQLVRVEYRLEALFHDASEAYLGDVVSPLKHLGEMHAYRDIEGRIEQEIFDTFNVELSEQSHADIRHADLVMLATERRDLMAPSMEQWPLLDGIFARAATITPLMPQAAEALFIKRFKELAGVQ
jgi:5'-deoxynucleotidase YfbR-like HD superfamily hydrolase